MQDRGAASPCPHDDDEGGRDQHRNIAAVVDLQEVGAEEDEFEQQQRQQHEQIAIGSVHFQRSANEFEGQDGRDDHRAGDRNAVGGRQRFRRAEHEHQRR